MIIHLSNRSSNFDNKWLHYIMYYTHLYREIRKSTILLYKVSDNMYLPTAEVVTYMAVAG